jgi:hypothetical protein
MRRVRRKCWISTIRRVKNQIEAAVPYNNSAHLEETIVPLPFCSREGDHRGRVKKQMSKIFFSKN